LRHDHAHAAHHLEAVASKALRGFAPVELPIGLTGIIRASERIVIVNRHRR